MRKTGNFALYHSAMLIAFAILGSSLLVGLLQVELFHHAVTTGNRCVGSGGWVGKADMCVHMSTRRKNDHMSMITAAQQQQQQKGKMEPIRDFVTCDHNRKKTYRMWLVTTSHIRYTPHTHTHGPEPARGKKKSVCVCCGRGGQRKMYTRHKGWGRGVKRVGLHNENRKVVVKSRAREAHTRRRP